MEPTSFALGIPCQGRGHYRFRMEVKRLDHCPVVCPRWGRCAGRWGNIRVKRLTDMSEDTSGLVARMVGRTLALRER